MCIVENYMLMDPKLDRTAASMKTHRERLRQNAADAFEEILDVDACVRSIQPSVFVTRMQACSMLLSCSIASRHADVVLRTSSRERATLLEKMRASLQHFEEELRACLVSDAQDLKRPAGPAKVQGRAGVL